MIYRFVFVAMPLNCLVTFLQLVLPEVVPYKVIGKEIMMGSLDVQHIVVGLLPAGDPGEIVFEVIVVPVIDILDRCKEACPLDSRRIKVSLDVLKGQIGILDAAVHMGINDLRTHLSFLMSHFCKEEYRGILHNEKNPPAPFHKGGEKEGKKRKTPSSCEFEKRGFTE
jgi:hypothetical protein